jgi:hypothetical protein
MICALTPFCAKIRRFAPRAAAQTFMRVNGRTRFVKSKRAAISRRTKSHEAQRLDRNDNKCIDNSKTYHMRSGRIRAAWSSPATIPA